MKNIKLKSIFYVIFLALLSQSCAEDPSLETVADEFRGGDNQGGRNDRNQNVSVDELDPELLQDWTALILEIERHAAGMRPNASARALAYIYLATYETAVPGMREYSSTSRQLRGLNINERGSRDELDWEIALNAALEKVVDHFILNLPQAEKAKIAEFANTQYDLLRQGISSRVVRNSVEWGESLGEQIIEYSQTDASAESQILEPQPLSYEPPVADGYWTYSADPERALFPYWESVRTFAISPEETTTVEPVAYSTDPSSNYYEQMMEVYEVNNEAKANQGEQLHIAEFWSDDVEGLMMSPPARQVSIAKQLVDKYELNLEEALELYVKLGFSLNDAAVATWKYKYEHMVMRPSVYIKERIDPDYQTNLFRLVYWPNPSFPGYPSGHSCFASAAAGVFIDSFGDETNFTDTTHEGRTEFLGAARTFSSFSEMADENGYSRIPLGVHIRMDCTEGLRLGYEIADAVNDFTLKRNRDLTGN